MATFGSNRTSQPKSETILVASGDQALAAGSLIPATGNVAGIADGQLGMVSAGFNNTVAANDFLAAGATVATDPQVKFVQGTPGSADVSGLYSLPISTQKWIESPVIDGRNALAFSAKACSIGEYSAWEIGNAVGSTDAINVASSTQYNVNIGFNSVRGDRRYSITGLEMYTPYYTTPDYTVLGYNATESLDHFVHNMVYNINLNSEVLNISSPTLGGNKKIIAFGISSAGGSTGTAVDLGAVAVGTTIDVVTVNGTTHQYVATQEFVNTLTATVANSAILTATSEIVLVDLAAASTLDLDMMLLIGTDYSTAFVKDTVKEVRNRIFVGLEDGFDSTTVNKTEVSYATEGTGTGRQWQIQWESRAGLNIWTEQNHPRGDFRIEVPSYVDTTQNYTAYIIEHIDYYAVPYSHISENPDRIIILVPCTTAGVTDAATLASLNAIVGAWLDSAPSKEAFETTGTAPNYFI